MRCLHLVSTLLALSAFVAQNIIFTSRHLKIHSSYDANDSLVRRTVERYVTELETKFANSHFIRQKAEACANILRYYLEKHQIKFDQHLTRKKRGIPFIGEAWSWLSDSPSPSEWRSQRRIIKDLIKLEKKDNKSLNFLKNGILRLQKSVVLENEKLVNIADKIETNLSGDEKLIHESNVADTLCSKGTLLALELDEKRSIIEDIKSSSESSTPSRFLFPLEKLHQLITEHSLTDKILSPVFLTESEIQEIYTLKSSATVFNETSLKIDSIIQIPLADYSLMMVDMPMPNFNEFDQSRMRKAELFLMQKIDILLCSESQKSLRFFPSSELETCQKHLDSTKQTYICESRDIFVAHRFEKCNEIRSLPTAFIIEIDQNTFYFDHPPAQARISCANESSTSVLQIPEKPTKIKLAEHCSLHTDLVTIGSMTFENDTIESPKEKFEIFDIPIDYSFRVTQPIPKNESIFQFNDNESDILKEVSDDVGNLENDEKSYEKQFESSWTIHFSLFPSILSIITVLLTIANTAAMVYCCKLQREKISKIETDIKKLDSQALLGETRDVVQFGRIRENSCPDLLAEKLTPFLNEKLSELKNEIGRQQKSCEFHFSNRFDDQKKKLKSLSDFVANMNQKCMTNQKIEQILLRLEDQSDQIIDLELWSSESKASHVRLHNELQETKKNAIENSKCLAELGRELETYLDNESSIEKELKQLNETEQKNRQADEKLAKISNAVELLLKCIDKINKKLADKDDETEYEFASLALKDCIDQLMTKENDKKDQN